MKKLFVLLMLGLMLTGCGAKDSIIGQWESENSAGDLGLNMSSGFISTISRIVFLEDGKGAWEIEIVQSREILHREFTFTLEGDQLTILYLDNTMQKFTVDFEDGILLLTGQENFSLKRVK